MADLEEEALETLLNEATNPSKREQELDVVTAFCTQVNKELEGPQIAVRLISHKIQSPQEREALYTLRVLEECVRTCGRRFHSEIGKFRFLNEMIKLVSPKYLGEKTTEKVKKKTIELIFLWTTGLKHETKILEAYQMLKKQGILKDDPVVKTEPLEPPPPPREDTLFAKEEDKSKLLARLLKSKHPEDLQAANRLIKNMVKQDAEKQEKIHKRVIELETVNNNLKLLEEMLNHHNNESCTQSELDIMKELFESLEKQRPKLFRLASDTDESDNDAMTQVLRANDEVTRVMGLYRRVVGDKTVGATSNGDTSALLDFGSELSKPPAASGAASAEATPLDAFSSLDLADTKTSQGKTASTEPVKQSSSFDELGDLFAPTSSSTSTGLENFGDFSGFASSTVNVQNSVPASVQLASLSAPNPLATLNTPSLFPTLSTPGQIPAPGSLQTMSAPSAFAAQPSLFSSRPTHGLLATQPPVAPQGVLPFAMPTAPANAVLQQSIQPLAPPPTSLQPVMQPMATSILQPTVTTSQAQAAPSTNEATRPGLHTIDVLGKSLLEQHLPPDVQSSAKFEVKTPLSKIPMNQMKPVTESSTPGPAVSSPPAQPAASALLSLADVFVPLTSVVPGSIPSVTAFDKNNLKIVIHFGKDRPRQDVTVMVVSIMNTNASPVKSVVYQAAVPKHMKVKLQPPSATDLPAYNPILPPTAITQVMLLANPQKEKVRLKFKLSYNMNDQLLSDVGEVDKFPDW